MYEEEEGEEHMNHEAWIIPYADMLTLLMALFLMLYAIGTLDLKKFEQLSRGLSESLNPMATEGSGMLAGTGTSPIPGMVSGAVDGEGTEAVDEQMIQEAVEKARREQLERLKETEKLALVQADIEERLRSSENGAAVEFRNDPRGLVITVMTDDVMFPSGSAEIRPAGQWVLSIVAASLRGIPNDVVVEGHTDNTPINSTRFPTNWELSTSRSTSVLRMLLNTYGLPSDRVSAAGYGSERPIATNSTEAGRARNRRVELVIVSSIMLEDN